MLKIAHEAKLRLVPVWWRLYTQIAFYSNGIVYGKGLYALGNPYIHKSRQGKIEIGDNFRCRSWQEYSDTGENMPFSLITKNSGHITIGNNVGITSSMICCWKRIIICDDVKIGGGTRIFDTNYHSVNPKIRKTSEDKKDVHTAPVIIHSNVFVGTACIITKGVTIGENSIIAAGSVVVKDIPANEVWGGNPAKFIRKIL